MTPETSTQRAHTEGRSPAEVVSGDDGNGCPGNNSSASVFEEAIRVEKPPAPFEALETAAASRGLGALTTGTSTETPSTAPTGAGRPEEHSGTASRVGALGERQSWPARGHGVPNARGVVGAGTTTAARMHTLGRGGRVVVQQPSSSAEQNAKPDVRSESADTPEATTAVAAAAMLKASRNDTGDRTAIPSPGPVVRSAQQAAWSRQRSVPDPARNATGRIFSRATQGASARSATPTSDFPALVRENPTKPSAMQQRKPDESAAQPRPVAAAQDSARRGQHPLGTVSRNHTGSGHVPKAIPSPLQLTDWSEDPDEEMNFSVPLDQRLAVPGMKPLTRPAQKDSLREAQSPTTDSATISTRAIGGFDWTDSDNDEGKAVPSDDNEASKNDIASEVATGTATTANVENADGRQGAASVESDEYQQQHQQQQSQPIAVGTRRPNIQPSLSKEKMQVDLEEISRELHLLEEQRELAKQKAAERARQRREEEERMERERKERAALKLRQLEERIAAKKAEKATVKERTTPEHQAARTDSVKAADLGKDRKLPAARIDRAIASAQSGGPASSAAASEKPYPLEQVRRDDASAGDTRITRTEHAAEAGSRSAARNTQQRVRRAPLTETWSQEEQHTRGRATASAGVRGTASAVPACDRSSLDRSRATASGASSTNLDQSRRQRRQGAPRGQLSKSDEPRERSDSASASGSTSRDKTATEPEGPKIESSVRGSRSRTSAPWGRAGPASKPGKRNDREGAPSEAALPEHVQPLSLEDASLPSSPPPTWFTMPDAMADEEEPTVRSPWAASSPALTPAASATGVAPKSADELDKWQLPSYPKPSFEDISRAFAAAGPVVASPASTAYGLPELYGSSVSSQRVPVESKASLVSARRPGALQDERELEAPKRDASRSSPGTQRGTLSERTLSEPDATAADPAQHHLRVSSDVAVATTAVSQLSLSADADKTLTKEIPFHSDLRTDAPEFVPFISYGGFGTSAFPVPQMSPTFFSAPYGEATRSDLYPLPAYMQPADWGTASAGDTIDMHHLSSGGEAAVPTRTVRQRAPPEDDDEDLAAAAISSALGERRQHRGGKGVTAGRHAGTSSAPGRTRQRPTIAASTEVFRANRGRHRTGMGVGASGTDGTLAKPQRFVSEDREAPSHSEASAASASASASATASRLELDATTPMARSGQQQRTADSNTSASTELQTRRRSPGLRTSSNSSNVRSVQDVRCESRRGTAAPTTTATQSSPGENLKAADDESAQRSEPAPALSEQQSGAAASDARAGVQTRKLTTGVNRLKAVKPSRPATANKSAANALEPTAGTGTADRNGEDALAPATTKRGKYRDRNAGAVGKRRERWTSRPRPRSMREGRSRSTASVTGAASATTTEPKTATALDTAVKMLPFEVSGTRTPSPVQREQQKQEAVPEAPTRTSPAAEGAPKALVTPADPAENPKTPAKDQRTREAGSSDARVSTTTPPLSSSASASASLSSKEQGAANAKATAATGQETKHEHSASRRHSQRKLHPRQRQQKHRFRNRTNAGSEQVESSARTMQPEPAPTGNDRSSANDEHRASFKNVDVVPVAGASLAQPKFKLSTESAVAYRRVEANASPRRALRQFREKVSEDAKDA